MADKTKAQLQAELDAANAALEDQLDKEAPKGSWLARARSAGFAVLTSVAVFGLGWALVHWLGVVGLPGHVSKLFDVAVSFAAASGIFAVLRTPGPIQAMVMPSSDEMRKIAKRNEPSDAMAVATNNGLGLLAFALLVGLLSGLL